MPKVKSSVFPLLTGLILIASAYLINAFSHRSLQLLSKDASSRIEKKFEICVSSLNLALAQGEALNRQEFYKLYDQEKIGIYLIRGKEGNFWNNAEIPLPDTLRTGEFSQGMVELRNGHYLYLKLQDPSKTAVALALCLIQPKYDVQNKHLKNDFSDWINLPEGVRLDKRTGTDRDVKIGGQALFSLNGDEISYMDERSSRICLALFIGGSLLLCIGLLLYFRKHRSLTAAVLSLLPFIIARLMLLSGNLPGFLEQSILFDVQIFANADSIMNARLADILLNGASLLFLSLLLFYYFISFASRLEKNLQIFLLFVVVFLHAWQFNHSLESLVVNSTLSFDFLNVFNLRVAVIVSLLAIVFNCMGLFVALYRALSFFNQVWWRSFALFMACNLIVCLFLYWVAPGETLFQRTWLLLFAALLYGMIRLNYQRLSLALGLLIALMSATTAGFFNHYINKNQMKKLPRYAEKLGEKHDSYLENEFAAIPDKIKKDQNLKSLIGFLPESKKELRETIRHKYFRGYLSTYDIDISMFDQNCHPQLEPEQALLLNEGFFEDLIRYKSDTTYVPDLYFVSKHEQNSQYVSRILLDDYRLYILMERKQFAEMGSFPELLLDQSQQKPEHLKSFSNAVYRYDQRKIKSGDFNYPLYLIDSTELARSSPGFIHHYFKPDEVSTVIISEEKKSWSYFFTYNSYLFLFFSVVSFFCYFLYAAIFTASFRTASLTRRIQTIIILLLLLAMTAMGITSGHLVTRQFESDNVKQLQEKAQTIISELSSRFKTDDLFSKPQKEFVNEKLVEFSHLYNSDITLFDHEGAMFNTSQPKLYELGLAARFSNPQAYFSLKENKTSAITVTEKAGTLNYLSLYTPVFNDKKEFVGFVNLPYFARTSDLTNELSSIISAFINVYILLFVISIVSGLILAGYITKPLRLIQQQISNITLGRQNETLKWQSNDEVGRLVKEYNHMLLKLEHSANLLAQSERESAWREMAKQVAHEIKNPLTPMKLNLQYLQHLMKNNAEDFSEKFEKASASIIEQIDTLARIATEFSNFAKLPGTRLQEINLSEIIDSSVNLFEQYKSGKIRTEIPFTAMPVMGDKEQALRIFNNILKNAIQATQDNPSPEIVIAASETEDAFVISVRDNGTGISEEMKEKIFTPNFTTKTTGSGLGLAMVKSIITNFGGRIWFESEQGKGATFYIQFGKAQQNHGRG